MSYHRCGGATANLKTVERFRLADANTIDYRYTVDDRPRSTHEWSRLNRSEAFEERIERG